MILSSLYKTRQIALCYRYDRYGLQVPGTCTSLLERQGPVTVFVFSVHEYWPTVDLRLVGPRGRRSDLTGEEANLTDRPALGEGVLKK